MAKLLREEQEKISVDCKRYPKKFWQYVNKKTKSKTHVGDLKWCNRNGNVEQAQNDGEKASVLVEGLGQNGTGSSFMTSSYDVIRKVNLYKKLTSK